MTVDSQYNVEIFVASVGKLSYVFKHEVLEESDIIVTLIDDADSATIVDPLLYTVNLDNKNRIPQGGEVVFNDPLASDIVRVVISRRTDRVQSTDFVPGPFPAETHELGLDRLVLILQEIDGRVKYLEGLYPVQSEPNSGGGGTPPPPVCPAPVVTLQPQPFFTNANRFASVGVEVTFEIDFTQDPLGQTATIQWFRDGVALPGENAKTLVFNTVEADWSVDYYAEITDLCGVTRTNNTFVLIDQNTGQESFQGIGQSQNGQAMWTCPTGVYRVDVVCIGPSGLPSVAQKGTDPQFFNDFDRRVNAFAGGGGGMGWRNNIGVVPGQQYLVQAPRWIPANQSSFFIDENTVFGGAGRGELGGLFGGEGGAVGGNGGEATAMPEVTVVNPPGDPGTFTIQSAIPAGGGGAGGWSGPGGAGAVGSVVGSPSSTQWGQDGFPGSGAGAGGFSYNHNLGDGDAPVFAAGAGDGWPTFTRSIGNDGDASANTLNLSSGSASATSPPDVFYQGGAGIAGLDWDDVNANYVPGSDYPSQTNTIAYGVVTIYWANFRPLPTRVFSPP